MSTKKQKRIIEQYAAKQKKLKKDVSSLKGELTKAEKKLAKEAERTERSKKKAKAAEKSASKAGARANLLQEQLDQASATLASTPSEASVDAATLDAPTVDAEVTEQETDGVGVPDESWSVVQLRAEARSRGMAGMSKTPKSELIAALTV